MFTGELIMGLTSMVFDREKQQESREDNTALMIACRKAASEIFDAQQKHNHGGPSFPLPAVTVAAIIYRHVREMKEL